MESMLLIIAELKVPLGGFRGGFRQGWKTATMNPVESLRHE